MSDETTAPQTGTPESEGTNLETYRQRRLAEIEHLRTTGTNPYPYRFDRTHGLGEIRAKYGELTAGNETTDAVAVCGRIMLKRDQGKLLFITIRDRSDDMQLFVSKSVVGDDVFDSINSLDLGDWVGAHGVVMTTRKGELSIKTATVQLLAKSLRPMPDKWHGLSDVDTRFRQRYADLIVNADARRAFEIRHAIVSSVRSTLGGRGYVEVETPVLHVEAGGAHARPFVTHHNTLDMQLFLRIALELHLKRLIVGGMERVFEIGRVFRNEGISTRHNPEFTMLESYEAFADYHDIMELTQAIIVDAARASLGTTVIDIGGVACDLTAPWPRKRMIDLASEKVGRELHPSQLIADVRQVATDNGVKWEQRWGAGRIIEEIFAEKAEGDLHLPTFVTGHPLEISPLARVDRNDPYLTERFELFVQARELANGYSELNDPVEQRKRFEAEQRAKEAGDATAGSVDEDYLRALEFGMPPTGGLGVGIDRLTMLLAGVSTIREVILFPTLRPEASE